jgi:hypothetical protein
MAAILNKFTKPESSMVQLKYLDIAASVKSVPFFEKENSALASIIGMDRNADLAYGEALFCQQGGFMHNGYYFTREFLLNNYKTAMLKPMNLYHMDSFVIGVIYDVALSKQNNKDEEPKFSLISSDAVIYDEKTGPSIKGYDGPIDVWVKFVLFKYIYPSLVESIVNGVSGSQFMDDYFVSMEVFYNTYKFLFDENESTAIDVTPENRFLIDYVGKTYHGKKVYRMYTGPGTFGGCAIVEDPANVRSVLSDVANRDVACSKINVRRTEKDTIEIGENKAGMDSSSNTPGQGKETQHITLEDIMDPVKDSAKAIAAEVLDQVKLDQMKNDYAKVKTDLDVAGSELVKVKTDLASAQAEVEKLKTDVATSATALDEAKKKVKENEDNFIEMKKKKEEAEAAVEEAKKSSMSDADKAELEAFRKEKEVASRISTLETKGFKLPEDKAKRDELVTKISGFSNEQFGVFADAACMNLTPAAPAKDAASVLNRPSAPNTQLPQQNSGSTTDVNRKGAFTKAFSK